MPALKATNILEIPRAKECSVTVLSISKEFGLPSLRIGFLAGNEYAIDAVREHNSVFSVMIPEPCQYGAKAAFDAFDPEQDKPDINARITHILDKSIAGWTALGWPVEQIKRPKGGFKYLLPIPPNIPSQVDEFTGVELLDFYIARRCAVKLSSSRSFNPQNERFIRIVIMQDERTIEEAFRRMHEAGIHYDMSLPEGIVQEYRDFLTANMKNDF